MTNHDLISSYIDNELSREQEQEFLIKLAANDNLRNSFRTELTLKNIVQRDESLITPPRALRASVFAAIGLSATESAQAATTSAATTTTATQSTSFFKTLFATKLNTAFTTLGLSVATLFGYVGNDMLHSESTTAVQTIQPASQQALESTTTKQPVSNKVETVTAPAEKSVPQSAIKTKIRSTAASETKAPAASDLATPHSNEVPQSDNVSSANPTVIGSGDVEMNPSVKKSSEAK